MNVRKKFYFKVFHNHLLIFFNQTEKAVSKEMKSSERLKRVEDFFLSPFFSDI